MKGQVIYDADLGEVVVKVNTRARHFIFRVRDGQVLATSPAYASEKALREALENVKPKLLNHLQSQHIICIDLDYQIDAPLFKLHLERGAYQKFLLKKSENMHIIVCPPQTDFSSPAVQQWLCRVVEESLRTHAKQVLPPMLQSLSEKYALPYERLRITGSRSRWGSCSSKKHISLSFYLLLLPIELVEYVMLHELTHTREMNHGTAFWALLDKLTGERAKALSIELRDFKTAIP